MKLIRIILITILIAIFVFLLIASKKVSESQDTINLPNRLFNDIRYYNDELSDSNGKRAFPWGIEVWADAKGEGYELPDSYFDKGQVQLTGHGTGYISVLAIPDVADKPLVTAGISYTQSFEIKLDNVQGKGVRVIHQWFDSTNPDPSKHKIIRTDYGKFETGTSDWHTVSLTRTASSGAVKGDIIIELWGTGTVYIRNPRYHMITILDVIHQIKAHDVIVWLIAICVTIILLLGFISLTSFIAESRRGGKT
jgi:hypothetical protein